MLFASFFSPTEATMCVLNLQRFGLPFSTFAIVAGALVGFAQEPAKPPAQTGSTPPPAAPTVPVAPEALGDLLMAQQRYQAAIEAYKKGDKNSGMLQNKLGIAYQLLGNTEAAARCYLASLRLMPNNAKVLNNLGTIYDSQKQYTAAEKMYRKSLKIEPDSAVVEKNLGTAYMAQHKFQKGTEAYRAALALDPSIFESKSGPRVDNPANSKDRGAINFYMAKSCAHAGMNDRAVEYLRLALNEGYTTPGKIMADHEFEPLRGLPAFDQLMAAQH